MALFVDSRQDGGVHEKPMSGPLTSPCILQTLAGTWYECEINVDQSMIRDSQPVR